MPNPASAMGAVQRSGVQKTPSTTKRLITGNVAKRISKESEKNDRLKRQRMANAAAQGLIPSARKVESNGKKRMNKLRSRITESNRMAFLEKGTEEPDPKNPKSGGKTRVYLVTIIEEGMGNSKDKNFYSAEALQKAIQLFNGAKAYVDHPDAIKEQTLPERSMKELVGWYSDCFVDTNPSTNKKRLRGKLHFFPSAKWLTDMIDTILTDPTAKELFGISINAIGKTRPAQMGGEEVNYVENFQRVDSADVVTEPAARGKFEKILESRFGARSRSGAVNKNGSNRVTKLREGLSPQDMKKLADNCTAAYNSDNPDEMKQALYEVQRGLYGATSISGRGPGQANEEQYSNINPSGGSEDNMATTKMKASGTARRKMRKRRMKAADGTGSDNENINEPSPSDIPSDLTEADVEDEEGKSDLGEFDDYGDSSKKSLNEAEEAFEDEAFEDEGAEGGESMEDEGMEGMEDEDGSPGQGGGMNMSPGAAAPTGGGAAGSSRMISSEAGDGDSEDSEDDGSGAGGDSEDDMNIDDDLGEAEARPRVAARPNNGRRPLRRNVAEAGKRRKRSKEASMSGGLGTSGHAALPKGADPTKGYSDEDEDFGKDDDSTSGVGKSYKIKTSVGRNNRPVHPRVARKIVTEANRRIMILGDKIHRLRESLSHKEDVIARYKGVIRHAESRELAKRLCESAVRTELLSEEVANVLEPRLVGKSKDKMVAEIKYQARLIESTKTAILGDGTSRLLESGVDGMGARGGAVSGMRSAADGDSELCEALESDGIPMLHDDEQ